MASLIERMTYPEFLMWYKGLTATAAGNDLTTFAVTFFVAETEVVAEVWRTVDGKITKPCFRRVCIKPGMFLSPGGLVAGNV